MMDANEHVIDAEDQRLIDWRELWAYRELLYFFAWRDIKIKYKQTVLGFLWAVLQPLIMMLILTLAFSRVVNVPSETIPYPLFIFSGLVFWNMFSSGLTNASNSMVNNALIIKKIYFPRIVIPASALVVALFDFLMSLIIFLLLLIGFRQSVDISFLWAWPTAILLTVIATLGPGAMLAALNVKYRDFRYVIPFLIQILFFLSPIIYPLSFLNYPLLRYVVASNPMYAAIELARYPLDTGVPLNTELIGISFAAGLVLLFLGLVYFRRTEKFFADLV